MAHGGLLVLLIFIALLCAAGAGMYLHGRLAERHRTSETTDHVRLVVSILVTFTALVLSLLLSEVKGSFDTFDARLRAFAGDLTNLDIHLREYGPDAEPIRATLRKYVAAAIADSWRDEPAPAGDYPRFKDEVGVERPAARRPSHPGRRGDSQTGPARPLSATAGGLSLQPDRRGVARPASVA